MKIKPLLAYILKSHILTILITIAISFLSLLSTNSFIKLISYEATIVLLLLIIYSLCRLYFTTYIITSKQIIHKRGIFNTKIDYMELYRVNDYKESQNFIEKLLHIKTITIFSNDQTNRIFHMIGIPVNIDIIDYVRKKVETSKKENKIYEIAN